MNKVKYRIDLDLQDQGVQKTIYARRGDTCSREIIFTLNEELNPYDMSEDTVAYLYGKNEEATIFTKCDIIGNVIRADLTTNMLSGEELLLELKLTDAAGAVLATPMIKVVTEDVLYSDDVIEATDDFSALLEAISAAESSKITAVYNENCEIVIEYADGVRQSFAVDTVKGDDGLTPYIKDGHWWIGDTDTGVCAMGADGYTPVKGVDYFDGNDGTDGVSISSVEQTATSSADGGTNVITVTLSNGTKSTFNLKNGSKGETGEKGLSIHYIDEQTPVINPLGRYEIPLTDPSNYREFDLLLLADQNIYQIVEISGGYALSTLLFSVKGEMGLTGAPGENGKDGTSVTVSKVTESTADGGSNIVTFSDGNTLTVKNGSKGSTGAKGDSGVYVGSGDIPDGYNVQIDPDGETTDLYDILSLGIASDGLIYIFVNGSPVGTGIPQGISGDVFCYVDENNNIIVSGSLADGSYYVKYEMEDGSTVNIGNLVLDSNTYYSITKNLTYCTINNSATQVVEGESYSATVTANDGYELKSVSVTMGGQAVSVSGDVISIANVTGDIVITAVAEESVVAPKNLLPEATFADGEPDDGGKGYVSGYKISTTSGALKALTGACVSGFIPVGINDTVGIENITPHPTDGGVNNIVFYDSAKAKVGMSQGPSGGKVFGDGVTVSDGVYSFTPSTWVSAGTDVAYFRFSCGEITEATIVTKV